MFTRFRTLAALAALAFVPAALAEDAVSGMKKGTPELKQAGPLAFGPNGILFVADVPNATIYAIDTADTRPAGTKKLSIANLSEVIGGKAMPRTEVTKKLWAYIKKNKLQDAKKRTMINADEKLRAVFGGKKQVSMFEMTKLVSKHLK